MRFSSSNLTLEQLSAQEAAHESSETKLFEAIMNVSSSCKNNYVIFGEFYEPKTSIYLVMSSSLLVNLVAASLSVATIWFERSRSGYMNTLMDKLKVSFCWTTLISCPIIDVLNILNYFFGPLKYSTCFFLYVFRNIVKSNLLFYFNCVAISRYIFIFWMKNPTSIDENFWATVISLSSVLLSCVLNVAASLLPQRHSIFLYICSDSDPTPDLSRNKLMLFQLEVAVAAVVQLVVFLRIRFYKRGGSLPQSKDEDISSFNYKSFTVTITILSWLACYCFLQVKVNSLTMTEVNTFPNYIFMYLYQLFAMEFTHLAILAVSVLYNKDLRRKVVKKLWCC